MSMSQANAALLIDVAAETSRLGVTLTQAERLVDQSAMRMGRQVDGSFGKFGDSIARKMTAAIGAGLAIRVVDDALRKVADGIRESQGAAAIGEAIANSIVESIRAVPIAGALMEISSQVADEMLGGPMATEQARLNAAAMQAAQKKAAEAAPAALRELELMGAQGEDRTRLEREQYLERVERLIERAKAGRVQIVDGVEQELVPGTLAQMQQLRSRAAAEFDVQAAIRRRQQEEAQQDARERHRQQREREAAQAAEDNARKIKEQQADARRTAIMALESQIQAMTSQAAPTRGERLTELMQGMQGGIGMGQTVMGQFTFATGEAAQVSRGILDAAEKQLATLERIEAIQEEIRKLQQDEGFH